VTKSLDTFDFLALPSLNKKLVLELARCEFIDRRENVLALGNSGTGKTHIALALGLAACQRGRFDAWLHRVTSKPSGFILYPLRMGSGLVRLLLWPAMVLAHWLVADLIRQREENAYRYEARLIGSEKFANLQQLQDVLEFTWQGAHADLEFQHRERQLVDNLPRQVLHNFIAIPEEVRSALVGSVPPPPPQPYSCQLTEVEQLALAHAEHAPGVLRNDLPAYLLLKDFDSLSRDLTWDYYLATFGPPLVRRDLKPVARVEDE
jgi:hypothetical protein